MTVRHRITYQEVPHFSEAHKYPAYTPLTVRILLLTVFASIPVFRPMKNGWPENRRIKHLNSKDIPSYIY